MFVTKWAYHPLPVINKAITPLTGVKAPNIQFVRPFIKVKKLHLQLGNQANKFLIRKS